ncbi:flagellar protein FlaG [Janthinobacterium sp.]|uniref:flagellar protein FlaG n=1 Tax=Janthinobacterium sp. TaxID=1871054 RepID=UPI00293D873C|nr:flagellar protein FlaG [Janthinobacterium sp.]
MNVNLSSTIGKTPAPVEAPAVAAPPPSPPTKAAAPLKAGAAQAEAEAAKPAAPPSDAEVKKSLEAINHFLKNNSEVHFSIDDTSGMSVIKVIDIETKKVLRQFPSEQALEIGKKLDGFKGLLIDGKA